MYNIKYVAAIINDPQVFIKNRCINQFMKLNEKPISL